MRGNVAIGFTMVIYAALLSTAQTTSGQTEDLFSIRVESDLVLVQTAVYDRQHLHYVSGFNARCEATVGRAWRKLSLSEPYLPRDCWEDIEIRGLSVGEFHVFEDGIEQSIQNVRVVPWAEVAVRDNFPFHYEWFYTPMGKWSTWDIGDGWGPPYALSYYVLAYRPLKPVEGKCHSVRVTVDRPNAAVFARDESCYTKRPPTDPLNGTDLGKRMEADLYSDNRAKIELSIWNGFFYTDAKTAKVDIVIEIPWTTLKRGPLKYEWKDWNLHATIGVLGMVYKLRRESGYRKF